MNHKFSDRMICAMPGCGVSWAMHQVIPVECPSDLEKGIAAITRVRGPAQDLQLFTLYDAMAGEASVREITAPLGLSIALGRRACWRGQSLAKEIDRRTDAAHRGLRFIAGVVS